MTQDTHTVTVNLTDEEQLLLESLAQERGLTAPADALRALLHEAVKATDEMWDRTFEESQDVLDRLADEGHAEYLAGLTEDFDPDTDEDAP